MRFGTRPQWTWECCEVCLGVHVACLMNREGGLGNVGLGYAHIGLVMLEMFVAHIEEEEKKCGPGNYMMMSRLLG